MTRVTEAAIHRPSRRPEVLSLCLLATSGDVGTATRTLTPPVADLVAKVAADAATAVGGASLDGLSSELAEVRRRVGARATSLAGPGFGVARAATNLVIDALWDLWARSTGRPLWKLVVDLTPEALLRCIDLDAVGGSLTESDAADLLGARLRGRAAREADLRRDGYPVAAVIDGDARTARRQADDAVSAGHRVLVVPTDPDNGAGTGTGGVSTGVGAGGFGAEDPRPARNAPPVTTFLAPTRPWTAREALDRVRTATSAGPGLLEPVDGRDLAGLARLRAARSALDAGAGPLGAGAVIGHPLVAAQLVTGRALDLFRLDPHRLGLSDSLALLLLAARHNLPVCPVGPPPTEGAGESVALHLGAIDVIAVGATVDRRWIDLAVPTGRGAAPGSTRHGAEQLRGGRIGLPERGGADAEPATAVDPSPSGARR